MTTGDPPDDPRPELGGDWQLDAEPILESGIGGQESGVGNQESACSPGGATDGSQGCSERSEQTPETKVPDSRPQTPNSPPPSPEQLVEAMLFVGGPPLTPDAACSAIRGVDRERFLAAIDTLNRRYRSQRRPYAIEPRDDGYVLAISAAYRGLRERLFGGPREARLSQPALDVLSVVAYRQPIGKAEIDAIRGTDSGSILRQLVRLGLIAVQHRAEAGTREVRYGTTPRFLEVFHLGSLEELPRLGDTAQV